MTRFDHRTGLDALALISFISGIAIVLVIVFDMITAGITSWFLYVPLSLSCFTIALVVFVYKYLYFKTTHLEVPEGVIRVVAIDDEADILRLIRIKLTKEGFHVSTAQDGDEGTSKVLEERPDVMLVDVMMPSKDGYQVVEEVKKKLKDKAPIVIMLTSKAEESDMVKGLSSGADDYITKPFSPSELIERINVALIKDRKSTDDKEDN